MIIFIETFVRSFDLLGGIMTVTSDFTQKLYENFAENTKLRAVENAVTKNGLLSSLEVRGSHAANLPEFSIDLTKDPVTNQKTIWSLLDVCCFEHFPS